MGEHRPCRRTCGRSGCPGWRLGDWLESQDRPQLRARSARLLLDDPDAIVQAHQAYFAAGAQVATTASYQASIGGFAHVGFSQAEAEQLIIRSVRLAEQARANLRDGQHRWIAGSVGPYGAALADGSEYRGDYDLSIDELRAWHRPRIALLIEAGVDILALETIPCLAEVEALLAEIDEAVSRAGCRSPARGTVRARASQRSRPSPVREVDEIIAVGVNCIDPADAYPVVRRASESTGKPVVVYPNSGERWDATARVWIGPATFQAAAVEQWISGGARLGGCCRVGPTEIKTIRDLVSSRSSEGGRLSDKA